MVSTPVDLIFSSVSCWAATGPLSASPRASTRTTATVFFMGPPSMGEDLRQELLAAVRFRRGEEVLGRRLLDHLSLVHEHDAVGDAAGASFRTFLGASMMFSSAVMCGKRLKDWNTMPTRVRSAGRFTPRLVTESPSTTMSPACTRSRPLTQRMSVDLPEPDGPHTTTTSPAPMARLISRSTWSLPNHLLTSLKTIAGAAAITTP